MRVLQVAPILAAGVAIQLSLLSMPVAAGGGQDSAEIPYGFVPLWDGFYFGAHGGGALGNAGVADSYHYNYYYNGSNNTGPLSAASNALDGVGYFGGAQAGYNIQWRRMVFGLEGDVGYLALNAAKSLNFTPSKDCLSEHSWHKDRCAIGAAYSSSGGLYGDLTGRLGLLLGRTLFYGKGGAAILQNNFQADYTGGTSKGPHAFDFGKDEFLLGWTAGGGVEYAFNTSWSFKVEYQHFDFLSSGLDHAGNTAVNTSHGQQTYLLKGHASISPALDTVKLGINYHLNDEAELK